MDPFQTLVLDVMTGVQKLRSADFSGLGVVFYLPPLRLPAVSLGRGILPDLPITGVPSIVAALAQLSDKKSAWHDGFHLVDAQLGAITHIAQFIAPPLGPAQRIAPQGRPTGARQMTALLTSTLPGVFAVALLTAADEILVYSGGDSAPWSPTPCIP